MKPVTIPTTNPRAERARIYREAKKNGQRVTVRVFSTWVEVTYHPEPAHRINYLREFTQWLSSLPYGQFKHIPGHLQYSNEAYIRTCISKSGLDAKYDSGVVTRMPAALRKDKETGWVVLRIHDKVVQVFYVNRICYLDKYHRDLVDEQLEAAGLGLSFEDL